MKWDLKGPAACLLACLLLSGCGAYHEAEDVVAGRLSNGLTVTQVTAGAGRLGLELGTALQTFTPSCGSNATSYTCTQPISNTMNCAGGGTLTTVGSATATWIPKESGTGIVAATTTPASCSIPGTSLVLSSSGNLTASGQLLIFNGAATSYSGTVTVTVTFGPTPSVACAINLNVTDIYAQLGQSGSCQVQGTICGQVIGGYCE